MYLKTAFIVTNQNWVIFSCISLYQQRYLYVSNSILMSKMFLLLSKIVRKDVAISNLFLWLLIF